MQADSLPTILRYSEDRSKPHDRIRVIPLSRRAPRRAAAWLCPSFAVKVLSESQRDVSVTFAVKTEGRYRGCRMVQQRDRRTAAARFHRPHRVQALVHYRSRRPWPSNQGKHWLWQQWFLAGRQVLIESGQQRGLARVQSHDIDEIHQVSLSEDLHCARVGFRTHVVSPEKFSAEFD